MKYILIVMMVLSFGCGNPLTPEQAFVEDCKLEIQAKIITLETSNLISPYHDDSIDKIIDGLNIAKEIIEKKQKDYYGNSLNNPHNISNFNTTRLD